LDRTICGFLNTSLGGSIYLGVADDGSVLGLPLTLYQRDHVIASLRHTLILFTPKYVAIYSKLINSNFFSDEYILFYPIRVTIDSWWVNFVPVLQRNADVPVNYVREEK